MKLLKIEINNFRNYSKWKGVLSEKFNYIIGKNGTGKTNLLEAIFFSGTAKSFRTSNDKELIKEFKENARVWVEIENQFGKLQIETRITDTGKTIFINNQRLSKTGDLIGQFLVVLINPDDTRLILDGPQDRRKFMDLFISQMNREYFEVLKDYKKLLLERNKLIKQEISKSHDKYTSCVKKNIDKLIAKAGSRIVVIRKKFIEKISLETEKIYQNLSGDSRKLKICYRPSIYAEDQEKYLEILQQKNMEELKYKTTTTGPHRDDIDFLSEKTKFKIMASQGQLKCAGIALKLSLLILLEKITGEKPVVLVDDATAYLDEERNLEFMKFLKEDYQVFFTGTDLISFPNKIDDKNIVKYN